MKSATYWSLRSWTERASKGVFFDMDTGSTPVVPQGDATDPSALTTQALWREIGHLKELILARLDEMEKAITVAHNDLVRVPTEVQKAVAGLKELHEKEFTGRYDVMAKELAERFHSIDSQFTSTAQLRDEKFKGVQKQFEERDTRVEQSARDTKTAVDAALSAQEKAVTKQNETFAQSTAKTEESFTKQLDQIVLLQSKDKDNLDNKVTTGIANMESRINELTDRLNRGEGRGEGIQVTRTTTTHNAQWVIGVAIGGLISLIAIGISLVTMLRR